MTLNDSTLLLLGAPVTMLLVSLAAVRRTRLSPTVIDRLSIGAAAFGVYVAAIGVALLINHGPTHSTLLGWPGFSLSLRLDLLSVSAFLTVSVGAFYFVRLIRRQNALLGRLSATVASIQLLLLTGHVGMLIVASIMVVLTLYELLAYYRARRGSFPASHVTQLGNPHGT